MRNLQLLKRILKVLTYEYRSANLLKEQHSKLD